MDSLGRLLLGAQTVTSVLHRAASIGQRSLPGAEDASVTLVTGPRRATAAWTGLLAFELDECQYGLGYGPCMQAADVGAPVVLADTATDDRWPSFVELAQRQGVRSMLAVPIPIGSAARAALNLYATTTDAFSDPSAVAQAMEVAGQAAAAIANMHDLETARTEVANLQTAMASRACIEQAKGVLMALHGYDADEAFQVLSQQSQRTNTKLRDVAAQIVDQMRRPEPR